MFSINSKSPSLPLNKSMEPSPEEEEDDEARHYLSPAADAAIAATTSRPICPGCNRPSPVCLCPYLPAQPIPTRTQIIILQHPHEARHKLSTTPVLTRCLANSVAVVARRLRPGLLPLLDQSPPPAALYLFPPARGATATPLSQLRHQHRPSVPSVLIAFDATWRHAGEMVRASEGFLGGLAATRVCLDDAYDESASGASIYDESALVLRKEPCGGCVSTMEAVARALGALERPDGPEIEATLVGVLREMVRLQAQYLKPIKPRPKLEKKVKVKGRGELRVGVTKSQVS